MDKYDETTDITLKPDGTFTYKHTKTSLDTYDYDRSVTTVRAKGNWEFDNDPEDDEENDQDDNVDENGDKDKDIGDNPCPSLADGVFVKLTGSSSEKSEWDSYNDFCNGEAFYKDNGEVQKDNFTYSFHTSGSGWYRSCVKYKD